MREFGGVVLFAAALLWLIALVSYSPADPAWFFNNASASSTDNFAGPVGAFVAVASFQLLGYASFLIPILFAYVGWHYFWCREIDAGYTKLVGAGLLLACAAGLLSLAGSAFADGGATNQAGGVFGIWLATGLSSYLNRTGAAILILTLFALSLILSTQFSFGRASTVAAERLRDQKALIGRWREWWVERRR